MPTITHAAEHIGAEFHLRCGRSRIWNRLLLAIAFLSIRLRLAILAFALLSSLVVPSAAAAQEQIELEAESEQGTFIVEITWTPRDIGSANAFDMHFFDPETGVEIEDVIYDFSVYREGDREVFRRDQTATRQEFTFDRQGPYEIRLDDIEDLGEGTSLSILVTPEFPLGTLVVVAGAIGSAVLFARCDCNNIFRLIDKQ